MPTYSNVGNAAGNWMIDKTSSSHVLTVPYKQKRDWHGPSTKLSQLTLEIFAFATVLIPSSKEPRARNVDADVVHCISQRLQIVEQHAFPLRERQVRYNKSLIVVSCLVLLLLLHIALYC